MNSLFTSEVSLDRQLTHSAASEPWSAKLLLTLILSLGAAIALIVFAGISAMRRETVTQELQSLLAFKGLSPKVETKLDQRFRDADGDLIADPPISPSAFVNPETLVLAHYLGDDEGRLRVDWKPLSDRLATAIGRKVTVQPYLHTPEDIAAIAAGKIHLLAAHSAEIPTNVNTAGLVPFAELATADAADGNRLLIATGADPKIDSLEDLRGQKLTCVSPDSITGFRAAIVTIYLETGMRPITDYKVMFSNKHERSARGLAIGNYQMAALSDDIVNRLVSEDRLRTNEYKVLHRSNPIPRLTFGHIHNLSPEIVDAVIRTIMTFENADGEPYRFQAINYKRDYDFIRRLDDAFTPRFGDIFIVD